MNPAVKNHTIENGEKISYNSLFANDCLYYEYTDENGGECEFFVVSDITVWSWGELYYLRYRLAKSCL
jgi:hypothetical protein